MSYRHHSYSGFEYAERHVREAKEFSDTIAGADKEVKEFFFSLPATLLDKILNKYGLLYGIQAEEYARNTFNKWKSGRVRMSGLVAKRLFDLLPPLMPSSKKYQIAEKIWRYSAPASRLYLAIGPDTTICQINLKIQEHLRLYSNEHMIPNRISSAFKWLSDNDVLFYEKMLNYFKDQEAQLAIVQINSLIPSLQQYYKNNRNHTNTLNSAFYIHKHEIKIYLIHNLGDKIRPYTPGIETNHKMLFYCITAAVFIFILSKIL